jgi:drug/metabolite transporter (DMT)-like permease
MADLVVQNGVGYKRRNPWGVFLLTVITLGVYYVVWYYKINNELNNYGVENNPTTAVLAITLGSFILVPPFVSLYKTAARILDAQERSNASERIIPVLALLLQIVVNAFALPYYQTQLNKAWDALARDGAEVRSA